MHLCYLFFLLSFMASYISTIHVATVNVYIYLFMHAAGISHAGQKTYAHAPLHTSVVKTPFWMTTENTVTGAPSCNNVICMVSYRL